MNRGMLCAIRVGDRVCRAVLKPIPLSDAEVRSMGIENVRISLDVEVGNNVIVTSGPLESFVGVVEEVNTERQKVRVLVSMFGRDTSVGSTSCRLNGFSNKKPYPLVVVRNSSVLQAPKCARQNNFEWGDRQRKQCVPFRKSERSKRLKWEA